MIKIRIAASHCLCDARNIWAMKPIPTVKLFGTFRHWASWENRWYHLNKHPSKIKLNLKKKKNIFYRKITQRYSKILKDQFLKKILLKRAKTCPLFCKTIGLNNFFYSNWTQFQVFKIAKFEFKVTVHYRLWVKCTPLWPLNAWNIWSSSHKVSFFCVYRAKFGRKRGASTFEINLHLIFIKSSNFSLM